MDECTVKLEETAVGDDQEVHITQWSSAIKIEIEDGMSQEIFSQWDPKEQEVAEFSGQGNFSHHSGVPSPHHSAEGHSSYLLGSSGTGAGPLTQGYPSHQGGLQNLEGGSESQRNPSRTGCSLLDTVAPAPSLEMLSQRGGIVKVLNGYKYTFQKVLTGGVQRFKCPKNFCTAHLKIKDDNIVAGNMEHTHPPVDDKVLQRQALCNSVKRKAVFNMNEKPSKLMKETAETIQLNIEDMSKRDIDYVRRILLRTRAAARSRRSQGWTHPHADMPLPLEVSLDDQANLSLDINNEMNLSQQNYAPEQMREVKSHKTPEDGNCELGEQLDERNLNQQNYAPVEMHDTPGQANYGDRNHESAEIRDIKTEANVDEPSDAAAEIDANVQIKVEEQSFFTSAVEDSKKYVINIQNFLLPPSLASSSHFDMEAMHSNGAGKRKAEDISMFPPIKVKNSIPEDGRSLLPNKALAPSLSSLELLAEGSGGYNYTLCAGGSSGQLFGSDGTVLSQWGAKRSYGAVMPKPPATLSGLDHLTNPNLNKGMGFTLHERQVLGIHGLLPPCYRDQEKQMQLIRHNVDKFTEPINKYTYLMGILERNEKLFFRFLSENVEDMMPIIYTPTVGLACQNYGLILRAPRGLFITIHDKGNVLEVLNNWPESEVKAIVVTDGERILGLGDLGAYGMGIPVGKLALFTVLAKVDPRQCLPVTLDVGTNNQQLLDDPFYIGLRQKRVTGREYDEFIEEFMQACVKRFGKNCLIQFEDFGNHNAFRLLHKYQKEYCTFNDDIQGTAAVCVAGVLASLRATKTRLSDHTIVFQGAGEASLGIAELCVKAMKAEGTSEADARAKIFLVDSKGLIVKDRPDGGISEHKAKFAHPRAAIRTLAEVVKTLKPTILIGAAAIGGAFTPEILQTMAANNKQPVIFALSNPTSKAECTAEDAYKHTNGKCLFASGSPFQPVTIDGKTHYPGQGNNSYIFPGVALGVITAGIRHIDEDLFLLSAQSLANIVTDADLEKGSLYPPLKNIQDCSLKIAVKLVESAYKSGIASLLPEPEDKLAYIKSQLYDYYYSPAVPKVYDWPTKL